MELKEIMDSINGLETDQLKQLIVENEKEHETLVTLLAIREGKTLARKPRKKVNSEQKA